MRKILILLLHCCYTACSDGDVKLVGGTQTSEGTVEICFNNLWGLISDSDNSWDDNAAAVVCNQLGYTSGASKSLNLFSLMFLFTF